MISLNLREYDDFALRHFNEEYRIVDVKCYGGSPIEISDYCYDLTSDVEEWLCQNVDYFEYDARDGSLVLSKEEDAMLFKLTWL